MGESLRNQHGPANEIQICRAVYIFFYNRRLLCFFAVPLNDI